MIYTFKTTVFWLSCEINLTHKPWQYKCLYLQNHDSPYCHGVDVIVSHLCAQRQAQGLQGTQVLPEYFGPQAKQDVWMVFFQV